MFLSISNPITLVSLLVSLGPAGSTGSAISRSTAASLWDGARWAYRQVMEMVLCSMSSWAGSKVNSRHNQSARKRVS